MAKTKRNPLDLSKIELRSLDFIADPVARESARQGMIQARAKAVAEREQAKANRGLFNVKVSPTGYLIVGGNGTFRPLVFTYEGFATFLANIEAVKAQHVVMPKQPTQIQK